jgi:hypothetical protein
MINQLESLGKNGEDDKKNKVQKFRMVLKRWLDVSTFNALPNMSKTESFLFKIIWPISFLIGSAYSIYGTVELIDDYLSYNVNIQVTVYRPDILTFPEISFCNLNKYNIHGQNFLLENYLKEAHETALTEINQLGALLTQSRISYENMYAPYAFNLTKEQMFNLSYTIDDMLLNCRFNLITCNRSHFEHVYTSSLGNCYKFNSGLGLNGAQLDIQNSSNPGRRYGLTLELFVGDVTEFDLIKTSGIQLFVHAAKTQPLTDSQGVNLHTGHHTDVVVKKTIYTKQPTPYSNCLMPGSSYNSYLYSSTVNLTGIYEQKFCLELCFQKNLIDACGCYDVTSISFTNSTPCSLTQILDCGFQVLTNFYNSPVKTNCIAECPQECNLIEYSLELSQSDFPTPFYAKLLARYNSLNESGVNKKRNFTSYEQVKQGVLSVNVYFGDLSYTSIDEVPSTTFEQLIGNIGGILGIAIGASFLSFLEFLELAYSIGQYFFKIRKTKSSNDLKA